MERRVWVGTPVKVAAISNKVTRPGVTSICDGTYTNPRIVEDTRSIKRKDFVDYHLLMAVSVLSMSSAVIMALEFSS